MILLSMLAAAALAAAGLPPRPGDCPARGGIMKAAGTPEAQAQKLCELPPVNHFLTLYRKIDRCPAPVVVRYGIGSGGR